MTYPLDALKWLLSADVQDGVYNEPSDDKNELGVFLRLAEQAITYGTDNLDPDFITEIKTILSDVLPGTDLPDPDDELALKHMQALRDFANA